MPKATVNSDNRFYDLLILLKRHMRSCRQCRMARKMVEPYDMCKDGIWLAMKTADYYDTIISLRIAAKNNGEPHIFPCPKPSAHGKTYELTATPMVVTGYQDRIF